MRENRSVARASMARVGLLLVVAGTIDAVALGAIGVDLGVSGAILAWAGLVGIPFALVGWRMHIDDVVDRHPPQPQPPVAIPPMEKPETPDVTQARLDHRSRVQAVINAGEGMVMVFQPIIDLRDGSCIGHEALARFSDGRAANEWFDEAHAVGVGVELEMIAITLAIYEFGGTAGYLSINLSPATLISRDFYKFIVEETDATRLVMELTEHAVIEDYDAIRSALEVMRDLGARIAVDDAGSGISSMRHILTIAPDIIKLDRSLIATIDTDPARRALALSLAQFATEIGADLVAEGVERAAEMTACYESGVRYGQGYLLGRPGPLRQ